MGVPGPFSGSTTFFFMLEMDSHEWIVEIKICGDKKKTKTNRQTDGHMSGVIHRGAKLLEKINKKASLQMDLKGGGGTWRPVPEKHYFFGRCGELPCHRCSSASASAFILLRYPGVRPKSFNNKVEHNSGIMFIIMFINQRFWSFRTKNCLRTSVNFGQQLGNQFHAIIQSQNIFFAVLGWKPLRSSFHILLIQRSFLQWLVFYKNSITEFEFNFWNITFSWLIAIFFLWKNYFRHFYWFIPVLYYLQMYKTITQGYVDKYVMSFPEKNTL